MSKRAQATPIPCTYKSTFSVHHPQSERNTEKKSPPGRVPHDPNPLQPLIGTKAPNEVREPRDEAAEVEHESLRFDGGSWIAGSARGEMRGEGRGGAEGWSGETGRGEMDGREGRRGSA